MVQNPLKLSSWPPFGGFLAQDGSRARGEAKFLAKLAKLTPRWAKLSQLGTKMRQIGAKVALSCATWRQDGPKMANLRAFLEASRQLFEILDAKPQIAKTFEKP